MQERNEDDVVEVHISIAARPETVFTFLSDPAAFQQWMGRASSLEPGTGGAYRVVYPNGDVASGIVEEIVPNRRVVMSWGYENEATGIPPGSTRVEITLVPSGDGTEVTLRHTGLADATRRANHRAGWRHYLSSLSQLSSASLDGIVEERIDAYTAAWAETDSDARAKLLGSCWAPNAVFRDAMGYAEGLDDLSDYIATAQQFARGIALERVGSTSRSHGFASYRWRMVTPDGTAVMSGSNTAEFNADGMLVGMTGFWDRGQPA